MFTKNFHITLPIRIGVSACLLGEHVRYDGGHKHDRYITDTLGRYFCFLPVCPEVGCGLPIPREAMRLEGDQAHPRLMTRVSRIDQTERMFRIRRVDRIEKIEVRNLGIDDDDAIAGQPNNEVRFAVARLRLFAEIAMRAHAGGFDDPAQGFFAPTTAGLIGTEHPAKLQGFAGERLALLRQGFELFLDFAQRG